MKISVDIKQVRFYAVVGFAYLLMWMLSVRIQRPPEEFVARSINYVWAIAYITMLNFIFFEWVLRYASVKKLLQTILLLFAMLMLYSFGLYAWRFVGLQLHIYTEFRVFPKIVDGVSYHFPLSVASLFFFGIIRHIVTYIKLKAATQQLRIEKQAAELNYLKSQTNPHFLFNTLNNIYSLARDKSDLAPESILRLSKILRFMLYETNGDHISIEQELTIINDYIALEKLRYDESLCVNFNYDVEDMKRSIPPLLLIPLVENAFKHGVSETRGKPYVDIHLSIKNRLLVFYVKNSTDPSEEKVVKENIGLANLRRQLELLFTDYVLSAQQGESVFTATLKINLGSHV